MSKREGSNEVKEEDEAKKIWDCGSPLYDSHELVSLGHAIDRHIMALPSLGGSTTLTNQLSLSSNFIPSTEDEKASRRAKGSSIVSFFTDFLGKRKRKRKRRVNEERVEKPKKVKFGFYGILNRIGSWRK
ncbi:hypothetical protein Acr_08g0007220 [Actinidia rufa]|uniref:Uncharacterized protein n=1 Tax=Actinidia rufa TaxID=165716 RepID=A0A7J0F1H8_9ERIC|nr:hypothetical protein Acr_08g0007220 [Actinidia rufa]